jgi:hypothetical protein
MISNLKFEIVCCLTLSAPSVSSAPAVVNLMFPTFN